MLSSSFLFNSFGMQACQLPLLLAALEPLCRVPGNVPGLYKACQNWFVITKHSSQQNARSFLGTTSNKSLPRTLSCQGAIRFHLILNCPAKCFATWNEHATKIVCEWRVARTACRTRWSPPEKNQPHQTTPQCAFECPIIMGQHVSTTKGLK